MIRRLWDYARWRDGTDASTLCNPMRLVSIKGGSKRQKKAISLTVEEFGEFVTHLDGPFRPIALVMVSLGLRISEALALRWSDVNWLESKLTVERGIVRQLVDATKTLGSHRIMTITPELMNVLSAWKQQTQFADNTDWLFASPVQIGRLPWSYDQVLGAFQKAGIAAGVGNVTTHSLRHSYRSWLNDVGTGLAVQQQLMRHSDIRTTIGYGECASAEMQAANSRVAELAIRAVNGFQTDFKAS